MNCKYCGCSFKLTKLNTDAAACLECSGVVDDMSIEDEEIRIDIWKMQNPSGKTRPVLDYDLETDIWIRKIPGSTTLGAYKAACDETTSPVNGKQDKQR